MKKFLGILFLGLFLSTNANAWTFKSLLCDVECKDQATRYCARQVLIRTHSSTSDKIKEDVYNKCLDKYMSDKKNW